jgi:hypothetical protein
VTKNTKPRYDKTKLRQLQRKEKGKEEEHVKVGGTSLKRVYV